MLVLTKDYHNLLQSKKLSLGDIEKLYQVEAYLLEHFLQKHSLKSISRTFRINEFKLKFGFKKLFGTPVIRFVDNLKMAHGRRLILHTEIPIMEIADQLGYNHYNNFSYAFKRKFGQSPQQLRQKQTT